MKQFNFSIVLMGLICGLLFFGCSKGGGKTIVSDEDVEAVDADIVSNCEWSPPAYCKDEYTWKQMHELQLSKNVDCEKQCNIRITCEWKLTGLELGTPIFQDGLDMCNANCNKNGSFDYIQFATCEEMAKKVEELTMGYIATADLPECKKPDYYNENEDKIGPNDPCRLACNELLTRCEKEFLPWIKAGYHGNTDAEFCAGICWSRWGLVDTAWVYDTAKTMACKDAVCIMNSDCQWPPYVDKITDGDEPYEEPAKTDYEVTP